MSDQLELRPLITCGPPAGWCYTPGLVDVHFAGGGGTCEGMKRAGLTPKRAVNHWGVALAIHEANHPTTEHCLSDVREVEPYPFVDILWLSPDCTHFSKCKNGKPLDNKIRGLADSGLEYVRAAFPNMPRIVAVENVEELQDWCELYPADHPNHALRNRPIPHRKGSLFDKWVNGFRELGYFADWRVLRACDYGAPTKRRRLFVLFRLDAPPVWPEPTHGPGLLPYRTARECIDWTLPVPSIFGREKPYSLATQKRIARGLKKFGSPNLIQLSQGERVGQAPRIFDLDEPLSTIVASGVKQGLVVAFIAKHYGGHGTPGSSIDAPLDTITTKDHNALVVGRKDTSAERRAECRAWLDEFVGPGAFPEIEDLGMRPLVPRELARGMGLPDSYVLDPIVTRKNGRTSRVTKTEQVRAIGNMVPPAFAEAIVRANQPTAEALRVA
jgi:DNA (cytosine-5)-methyltransferase 1